jgi:type IX secretion system PorP/SprF family membrane protein
MKKWHVYIIGCFMLFYNAHKCAAQQLNLSSNTHYNIFNENIAFAGNYEATHFTTDFSKIWSVNGAPAQAALSIHTPLKLKKLGLGIKLNQVYIGAHEESTAKLALSYKIELGKGMLSFGLGSGISLYNFDVNKLNPLTSEDFLVAQNRLKNSIFDLDFGVIFTSDRTYAGVEINQIMRSSWNIHETDSSLHTIHFKTIIGRVFNLRNDDLIRISTHIRSAAGLKPQADFMANYFYNDFIWIGMGYRLNYGLITNLEFNVSRRLQFGYTYATALSNSPHVLSNRHHMFLGYMIPSSHKRAPKIRIF